MEAIFACTYTGLMGQHGTIPWPKNSEDLKWFRDMTTGHVVVMGRKTYEDKLMPKPLPNRINYVLTSTEIDNKPDGVTAITIEDLKTLQD